MGQAFALGKMVLDAGFPNLPLRFATKNSIHALQDGILSMGGQHRQRSPLPQGAMLSSL